MEASGLINPDAGYALIVNYLPPSFTDHDLHQLFTDVGPLLSAKVMRNKYTHSSFGYGFVNFVKKEDAERAIDEKDGEKVLHKRIRVAFSRRGEGPDAIKNANLFIGNLPLTWKESDLERAFSSCGKVIKSKVLIDQLTGISRGCGFVLFSKHAEAEKALKEINGQKLPGCDECLQVKRNNPHEELQSKNNIPDSKPVNTQNQKEVHVIHHYSHHPMAVPNQIPHPAMPNAQQFPPQMPMRFPPPYGGAAVGAEKSLIYPYHEYPPAFGGDQFHHLPPDLSAFDAVPPLPHVVSGKGSKFPVCPPQIQRSLSGPFSHMDASTGGVSLVVRNLGPRCTELDLYQLFGPYGAISKAHLQRDAMGKGKGFGFVTFKEQEDANRALETLHDHPWEKNEFRRLQVIYKIEK